MQESSAIEGIGGKWLKGTETMLQIKHLCEGRGIQRDIECVCAKTNAEVLCPRPTILQSIYHYLYVIWNIKKLCKTTKEYNDISKPIAHNHCL